METERGERSGFFGVGGQEPSSSFRGFGMIPSLFGGRDPFDDPFFTLPFASALDSSAATRGGGGDGERGVVIEELGSDDEADNAEEDGRSERGAGSGSSQEPSVEHPDDDDDDDAAGEGKGGDASKRSELVESEGSKPPQASKFSFSTRKVTYGGVDGAYYTSSRTRRTGDDGTVIEENREADKATGQATHRVSRGIHDKGHSVTRKLNSDGKVDTIQTLHNLHQDEIARFEEAWKCNFKAPSFGVSNQFGFRDAEFKDRNASEGWSLPSIERVQRNMENISEFGAWSNQSASRAKKVVRINIE